MSWWHLDEIFGVELILSWVEIFEDECILLVGWTLIFEVRRWNVIGRIISPQRCFCPNPQNLSMLDYMARGINIANGIKVAIIIWPWKKAQCNYKGPYKWNREAEEREPVIWNCEKDLIQCCWLWRWRKEAIRQRIWVASRNWKE